MKKPFYVGDRYRTNDLSLIEGGYTITITYTNGQELVYDRIKNPDYYLNMIDESDIDDVIVIDEDGYDVTSDYWGSF